MAPSNSPTIERPRSPGTIGKPAAPAVHHGPVPASMEVDADAADYRQFIRWFFLAALVFIAVNGVFNYLVDPTGSYGRSKVYIENAALRTLKAELVAREASADVKPATVVFGSSRAMKFDPADIEAVTSEPALNLAVSSARPLDWYLLTAMIEDQWGRGDFPHLIVEVAPDEFPDGERMDPTVASDANMRSYLRTQDQVRARVDQFVQAVDLRTTKLSIDRMRGEAAPVKGGGDTLAQRLRNARTREDGYLTHEYPGQLKLSLHERIAKHADRFERSIAESGALDGVGERQWGHFTRMIELANEAGDTPTIVIAPMQPVLASRLESRDYDELLEDFRSQLEQLEAAGKISVVDAFDPVSFGARAADFYDGVHPMPETMAALAGELGKRDLLVDA